MAPVVARLLRRCVDGDKILQVDCGTGRFVDRALFNVKLKEFIPDRALFFTS